jgi:hypothetical protein
MNLFRRPSFANNEAVINSIQVNRSTYGVPIPLVFGKCRRAGILAYYDDFTPHQSSNPSGGKGGMGGGSGAPASTYSAALLLILCEGPISGTPNMYFDKGLESDISKENLQLFVGAAAQSVWSYLTANHPDKAVPYDHTAYVASASFDLGSSASVPNLSFEVAGILTNSGHDGDASPASILSAFCSDGNFGCSFPYLATLTGTNSYDAYCTAMGFWISPEEETQRPAADFIAEIAAMTNSEVVWSAGTLKVIPLADTTVSANGVTWSPTNGAGSIISTPIYSFTDDDFIDPGNGADPVEFIEKPPAQTFNLVQVEYSNRGNYYNRETVFADDQTDITLNGLRADQVKTFVAIKNPTMARTIAQLILQRNLYYRNQYRFKVRLDYSLLEPMDVVAITDTALGLSNQLVRILEIHDDANDEIEILAEELPLGPGSAPQYNWQASQGYAFNTNVSAGEVAQPVIFTMPPALATANGGNQLGIAVAGAGSQWGGCQVLMSYDNVEFVNVGTIFGGARCGTLTANMATSASDLDVTNTLSIALSDTSLSLASASSTDFDNLRSLLWVDGEIMGFETATLTGIGAYALTTFHRGLYGSTPAAHASGALWARLDQNIFRIPLDPGHAGKNVYFKFPSFNIYGKALESPAASTLVTYSHTIGAPETPSGDWRSANVAQIGNSFYKTSQNDGWDSQAYVNIPRRALVVSCNANDTTTYTMFGLSKNPAAGVGYATLDFGLELAIGTVTVYEAGTYVSTYGSYSTNDSFAVEYDGFSVRYVHNGTVFRTVPLAAALLYADLRFYSAGSRINNVYSGAIGIDDPNSNLLIPDPNFQLANNYTYWQPIDDDSAACMTVQSTGGITGGICKIKQVGTYGAITVQFGVNPYRPRRPIIPSGEYRVSFRVRRVGTIASGVTCAVGMSACIPEVGSVYSASGSNTGLGAQAASNSSVVSTSASTWTDGTWYEFTGVVNMPTIAQCLANFPSASLWTYVYGAVFGFGVGSGDANEIDWDYIHISPI